MVGILLTFIVAAAGISAAHADTACEKKLNDTKMMFHPSDAKIMCDENLSPASQDCMVEVLTKGKGKLRNNDLFEVYGLCKVEPGQTMRSCLLKGLDRAWNDAGYKGAKIVGDLCMKERRDAKMASLKAASSGAKPSGAKPNGAQR